MESSKTEQMIYKGIKTPAKYINIGNNRKKLIPVSTNRYVLHGIPIPKDLKITEEIQTIAKEIINESKNATDINKALLIKYIRKAPDSIFQNRYFARRGKPYGAVVAFLHNEKLRIGWSKRIEGEMFRYGRVGQKELLPFTKKDAIYIAVLRGIVDSIRMGSGGLYTSENRIIPRSITKALLPFIKSVQFTFNRPASNISLN